MHTKKKYSQLVGNFCVYLQAKNQLHLLSFSRDITNLCKLLILGTLGCLATYIQNDTIKL